VIEVSNISSGKLTKTLAYQTSKSISSSNIILSPDETILYVVNTQGDSVSAYFFNKSTGAVTFGCQSNKIKGQSVGWSYLVGAALVSQTGNGGGLYVAEFGGTSGVSMVKFGMSGGTCTLQEMAGSPFIDGNSTALLSIGTYPPRAF
jgi:6-phosphogluconolactonase (cycloisomerase 2 family)